ncbi:glycosyltransferase [Stappia stellulata]|uniref:glycosyltransferase family 32 protein n=1 Tax=Stappia stellulata TaxID=71235 RepID=UPI001CD35587|nr:glycosyltransferase [Stappia stellulata]MCA1242564.1 glycosyltransferase [Stappia stellulata]
MLVPNVLHQTIRCRSALTPALHRNIATLKALNPDWEHRLYDDGDVRDCILRACGRERLALFDRIHDDYGAARADIFRYVRLYESGGVYLDIKSTVRRPLREIIRDDDAFLLSTWDDAPGSRYRGWGHWPDHGIEREFQQWHIVCAPRHPFLKAVIERVWHNLETYHPVRCGVGFTPTIVATGPVAYTRAIEEIRSRHPHRVVNAAALGLVYSIFEEDEPGRDVPGSSGYRDSRQSLLRGLGSPAGIWLRTALSQTFSGFR